MLKNTRKSQSGFTLVEIMIVVAIIALLAAIAVPGFLRARKRSQATAILNDARVLDGAKDQYAIERNVKGSSPVVAGDFQPYLKPGTRLYSLATGGGKTIATIISGGNYNFDTFDSGIKVDSAVTSEFSNVIENSTAFWGSFQ